MCQYQYWHTFSVYNIPTFSSPHTHARMHARTHTHIRTRIHMYTHTHAHYSPPPPPPPLHTIFRRAQLYVVKSPLSEVTSPSIPPRPHPLTPSPHSPQSKRGVALKHSPRLTTCTGQENQCGGVMGDGVRALRALREIQVKEWIV